MKSRRILSITLTFLIAFVTVFSDCSIAYAVNDGLNDTEIESTESVEEVQDYTEDFSEMDSESNEETETESTKEHEEELTDQEESTEESIDNSVIKDEIEEETETDIVLLHGEYTPTGASYSLMYDELADGTIRITRCTGDITGTLVIPEIIEGKRVTTIGDYAFYCCSDLSGNLMIPNSVTTIGDYAFYGCVRFTGELEIPNSVTTIGDSAFKYCSGFTGSLKLSNSVTVLWYSAFEGCKNFTGSLEIPNSVTAIGDSAFKDCSGFTGSLEIPNSVTTIGDSAFKYCSGFTGSLKLSNSVTTIGDYAFYNCVRFTGELKIPNSVTTIGNCAFAYCWNFNKLVLSNNLIKIEPEAFVRCSGFTGPLTIPEGVKTIGFRAFAGCDGLTELTIPESLTEIEFDPFESYSDCGIYRIINYSETGVKCPSAYNWINRDTKEVIDHNKFLVRGVAIREDYDSSLRSVIYDGNGATGGKTPIDTNEYKSGDLATVLGKSTLKRDGYIFLGWSDNKNDSKAKYKPNSKLTIGSKDISLYAIWKKKTPKKIIYENDDEIDINYAGYAIARVHLVDENGDMIVDVGDELQYGNKKVKVDFYDYVDIESELYVYSEDGNNNHSFITSIYDSDGNEIAEVTINNIVVKDLSYSQKWKGKVDTSVTGELGAGVGITIGPADVEASLGGIGATASMATVMGVENTFKEGQRNLSISQAYERKIGVQGSIGPKATALNEAVEIKLVEVSGKAGVGQQVSSGVTIRDYNPSNPEDLKKLGKYVLLGVAESSGDVYLMRLLEKMGYEGSNDYVSSKVTLQGTEGVDFLTANAKGGNIKAEAAVLSSETGGVLSIEGIRDRSDTTAPTYTKKRNYTRNESVSVLDTSFTVFKNSPISVSDGKYINEVSVSGKINSFYDTDISANNIDKISFDSVLYQEGGIGYIGIYNSEVELHHKIVYSGVSAKTVAQSVPSVGNFYTNYIGGLSKDDIKTIEQCNSAMATFTDTQKEKTQINIPIKIGLKAGVGLKGGVDLSGVYEESYDIKGGTYNYTQSEEKRKEVATNRCDCEIVESAIDESKQDLGTILSEPIIAIAEAVGDYVKDISGKVGEKVVNGLVSGYNKTKNKILHIISPNSGQDDIELNGSSVSDSTVSYEIYTYTDDPIDLLGETSRTESIASTVGEPYIVYLTDEDGNEVSDWEGETVTLEIGYTDALLAATGATTEDASSLAIYKYSQEKLGYVYKGGSVDIVNRKVTLDITEEGQYILAIDKLAPSVSVFTTENDSNPPVIIVGLDEMSDFSELSLKVDGEEVVNLTNVDEYYSANSKSIRYPVANALTPGLHKATFIASDKAGNSMAAPAELEINITEPLRKVSLDKTESTLLVGETVKLTPVFEPAENVNSNVSWSSTEEEVATVDYEGVVTGVSDGETDIIVTTKDGGLTAKCHIIVSSLPNGFYIKGIDKDGYMYTGSSIKPGLSIYCGDTLLKEKTDYAISFTNNTNVGENAQIKVVGKGNYKGQETETFKIVAKDISEPDVKASEIASAAYNKKKAYKPIPALTYNGKKLKNKTDFTVAYYSDEACTGETITPKDPGKYYAKVSGIKNFTGSRIIPFEIAGSEQFPVSKLTVVKIPDQPYNNGTQITPEPIVKKGNVQLTKDTDYTLTYGTNTDIGTGTVVITGKEPYVGTRTVTFKITGGQMSKVTIGGLPKSLVYDGTAQTPTLRLSYRTSKNASEISVSYATEEEYKNLSDEQKADIGCIVTYKNNTNVGKATVTFKGINGYSGTVNKTFKIKPFTVSDDPSDLFTVTLDEATYPYAKAGVRPVPTVKYKDTVLTEGKDYKLSYVNNTSVNDGSGNKVPTVKVTGKGNFKGTDSTVTFKITQADMVSTGVVVVAKDVVFQNKAGKWMSKYSVAGPDGKALKAGKDYDNKNVLYTYDEEGINVVKATDIVPAGTTIYVKVTAKGTLYSGSATGSYRIVQNDIGKLSVSLDPKTYTGKAITLSPSDLTWKSGKKKTEGVTFEIDDTTYKNNINKGKATVIVRGTGNYGGTKKITFTIGAKGFLWWWRNVMN